MWHKAEMESVGVTKIDERRSDCWLLSEELGAVQCCPPPHEWVTIKDSFGLIARNYPRVENKVKAEQVHCPVNYYQWWNYTIYLFIHWSDWKIQASYWLLSVVTIKSQPTHRDQGRGASGSVGVATPWQSVSSWSQQHSLRIQQQSSNNNNTLTALQLI